MATTPTRQDATNNWADTAAREGTAAPTPGYIYRGTGVSNVVAKALADTAANAAGILGVGHVSLGIAPITIPNEILFDSIPVVGATAYLSATAEGQATCTAPLVLRTIGIVRSIVSGSAPYRAMVSPLASSEEDVYITTEERLRRLACDQLSVTGDELEHMFTSYSMSDMVYHAGIGWKPNWGQSTDADWALDHDGGWCPISSCFVYNGMKHSYQFPDTKFGALSSVPWLMGMRAIVTLGNGADVGGMFIRSPGVGGVGIGCFPYDFKNIKLGYGARDVLAFEGYGNFESWAGSVGVATPGVFQTLWLKSLGGGHIFAKVGDGTEWTVDLTYNPADGGGGVEISQGCTGGYTGVEWWFFAHKAR